MASVIPLPKARAKPRGKAGATKVVQAHVPMRLYDACKQEWRYRGLTCKQVVAWALKQYLVHSNPDAARRVGVRVEPIAEG